VNACRADIEGTVVPGAREELNPSFAKPHESTTVTFEKTKKKKKHASKHTVYFTHHLFFSKYNLANIYFLKQLGL
jgi:hypothetical protein